MADGQIRTITVRNGEIISPRFEGRQPRFRLTHFDTIMAAPLPDPALAGVRWQSVWIESIGGQSGWGSLEILDR